MAANSATAGIRRRKHLELDQISTKLICLFTVFYRAVELVGASINLAIVCPKIAVLDKSLFCWHWETNQEKGQLQSMLQITENEISSMDSMSLSSVLNDNQKKRLANKLVLIHQDATYITLRALAVLSALNVADENGVDKNFLLGCSRFGIGDFSTIHQVAECKDCLVEPYLSVLSFRDLLSCLNSAMTCIKVHCVNRNEEHMVRGDEITRIRVRWDNVAKIGMACIKELCCLGEKLQSDAGQPFKSKTETWLSEVLSGDSILENSAGPFFEFAAALKNSKSSQLSA